MPLRDDLLNPIPGSNPSGENLRYAPIYDKIKEARRQDDDAPQGEWKRERKLSDWSTVIKLAQDGLASKSKDLQLATWLTEALLQKEGYAGFKQGLDLIKGLIETYWDTLYPELEDGDAELRAAPVEWLGTKLDIAVKQIPVTKTGNLTFLKYKDSRTVPSEEAVAEDSNKSEVREAAIAEGKPTPEEWDKAFAASSAEYYAKLLEDVDGCLQSFEELQAACEERFGEFSPSFSRTRSSLEEVRHLINGFYQGKKAPDPEPEPEPAAEASSDDGWSTSSDDSWSTPAATEEEAPAQAPVRKAGRKVAGLDPADRDEASLRLGAVAAWLRREDPYSPAPYLMLRGYRWGELRLSGPAPDASLLEAPSTEVRQNLKRLSSEGSWLELLEAAEVAMAEPCGRGWLDLQRHVVRACEELSYEAIASAVKSEVRTLVADMPDLVDMTLLDDTPAANAETQKWLKQIGTAPVAAAPVAAPVVVERELEPEELGEPVIDSYDLAREAAGRGRAQEAMNIMSGEISRQNSGRGRFQRKLQLAQLCIQMGYEDIARSILEELSRSIEKHLLEEWESSELIAQALLMLYNCMKKLNGDPVEMQKLYSRICRLDPMQALVAHAR